MRTYSAKPAEVENKWLLIDAGNTRVKWAWLEYLEATRSAGSRYAELEPWAWARLSGKLQEAGLVLPDEAAA